MLLNYLPLKRINKIDTGLSRVTAYDASEALAAILSFYEPNELLNLFWNLQTPPCLRAPISIALVRSLGNNALPYLKEIGTKYHSLCNSYALPGMQELQTEEAQRWICEEYIRLAALDNHSYLSFEEAVKSESFQPSLTLILQMIKKAKQVLKRKTGTYIYEHVIRILTELIERLDPEHNDALVTLSHGGEVEISEAATRTLVKSGNKEAATKLLNSVLACIDSGENRFFMRDIEALAKARDATVDSALWALFEKHLNSPNPHPQLVFLPGYIAQRTDEAFLRSIVKMVFKTNNGLSSTSLRIFMDFVPESVLAVARELCTTTKKHSFLWYLVMAARGYCGDKDVKTDLIEIINDLESIRYPIYKSIDVDKLKERIVRDELKNNFIYFIFHAVQKLKLVEAIPAIKQGSITSKSHYIKDMADNTVEFLAVASINSISQMRGLVCGIADLCHDKPIFERFWEHISVCHNSWSENLLRCLLVGLRDKIDEAMDTESDYQPHLLYALLSWLREINPKRFLDIFKGWPALPYEDGVCCGRCKRDFSQTKFATLYPQKQGLCIDCLLSIPFPYDVEELSNQPVGQDAYYRRYHCDYCGEDFQDMSFVRVSNSILCKVCWEQAIERIKKFRLIKEPNSSDEIEKWLGNSHPLRIMMSLFALQNNTTLQSDSAIRAAVNILGIGGPSFLWQQVRQTACDAIVKIGEQSLEYCLEVIYNTYKTNWRIKANVALVAGYFPDSERAHEILKQLAADSDNNVRSWVINAICDRSDGKAKKILSMLARDEDPEIAFNAKQIQRKIEDG